MGISRQPQVAREICPLVEKEISLRKCKNSFPLKMERSPAVSHLVHHYSIISRMQSVNNLHEQGTRLDYLRW